MAQENTITIVGNLVDDPELRYTSGGIPVANVRVAVNRRVRNKETNEWEDALDGYFRVNVWRDMAENVAESLTRGTRVIVVGRMLMRSWQDKDGNDRLTPEIEADEVSPSLRWATAKPQKTTRGGGGGQSGGGSSSPPPPDAPASDDVPF